MSNAKKVLTERGHVHARTGVSLEQMARDASDTILYDEEAVIGEILDAMRDMRGELSPTQVAACDKVESLLPGIRRRKASRLLMGVRWKQQAIDERQTSHNYHEASKKQVSPMIPYIFCFSWIIIAVGLFFSFDPDAMGNAIIMGALFIIIGPVCMIVSALMSYSNKKARHTHGIKDRELDMQDNINMATGIGGAAHSAWTMSKAPGELMKDMTTHKYY